MTTLRETADAFISRYGLGVGAVDSARVLDAFLGEMEAGLAGHDSSFAMIPTFLSCSHEVPVNEPVIVLDAGGTNLRVCTVTFQSDGDPLIEHFRKFRMPGIGQEVSKEQFYTTLVGCLADVADLSDKIGFCFSYPTEIFPNRDGKLIRWTKEVQIPELVGEFIGEGLRDALKSAGHGDKDVVILNDTVAALLAGRIEGEPHRSEDYVGFILGTGTNTAYVEKHSRITKREDLSPEGAMVINLESGNFTKPPRGTIDERFDRTTANPGGQLFEKMISGAYLGPLSLEVLRVAVEDNLFSETVATLIASWDALTTIDMDNFVENPHLSDSPFNSPSITDSDRELMVYLFSAVVSRAALLTAINIAGTVIASESGHSPLHPVCINIDGSTFYKTHRFPHQVYGHLDTILGERGINYITVHIDNAPTLGAAIAALS